MAREVAAILRKPLRDPVKRDLIPQGEPAISVRIDHVRTKEPLGVMKAVLDISAVQALASRAAMKIPGGDVKVLVAGTGDVIADTAVGHARKFIMSKEGNLLARHFKPAELEHSLLLLLQDGWAASRNLSTGPLSLQKGAEP